MVLRGEHDIARACPREEARPGIRIPLARRLAEALREALVREVGPVRRIVVRARRALREGERVPVPLGVGIARKCLVPALLREVGHRHAGARPGGNRVRAPVHEDPELRIREPARNRMRIEESLA